MEQRVVGRVRAARMVGDRVVGAVHPQAMLGRKRARDARLAGAASTADPPHMPQPIFHTVMPCTKPLIPVKAQPHPTPDPPPRPATALAAAAPSRRPM